MRAIVSAIGSLNGDVRGNFFRRSVLKPWQVVADRIMDLQEGGVLSAASAVSLPVARSKTYASIYTLQIIPASIFFTAFPQPDWRCVMDMRGHNSQGRQTVYRRHGNRAHTAILNSFLQDSRISHETKGLVAEMLSYPEDWDFTVAYLVKNGKSGRDKVYKMLKEAEKYGYIIPFKYRALDGKIQKQTYLVSDDPEALIRAVAEEIHELESKEKTEPSRQLPPPVPGVTYVYAAVRGKFVKVGKTQYPEKRITHINATSGSKAVAEIVFTIPLGDWEADFVERGAHLKLNRSHHEGEWFKCSPEEAVSAIKTVASLQLTENPYVDKVVDEQQLLQDPEKPDPDIPDLANPDTEKPDTVFPTQTKNIYNKKTQDKLSPNGLLPNVLDDHAPPIAKRKKKTISDLYTDDFNHFWALYPKREGKGEAAKSWHKLSMDEKRRAYSGLKKQLPLLERKMQTDGGKYCPMPATWINQGRFDDEPVKPSSRQSDGLLGGDDIPTTMPRPRDEVPA